MSWRLPRSAHRTIFALLLTGALLGLLLQRIHPGDIATALLQGNILFYIAAFLCYIASYLLRAVRLRILLVSTSPNLNPYYHSITLYNFLVHTMPANLGLVSLPFFLRKLLGVPIATGASLLALVKIFDLLVVLTFFAVSVAVLGIPDKPFLGFLVLTALILAVLIIWNFSWLLARIDRFLVRLGNTFRIDRLASWQGATQQQLLNTNRTMIVFATTVILWLSLCSTMWFLVLGFGLDVGFLDTVAASSIATLISTLPLNAVGNWGTYETGWTLGFALVGVSSENAIVSGFAGHILILGFSLVLAAVSYPASLRWVHKEPFSGGTQGIR